MAELAQLASTAGLFVVGEITQRISTPNPATLIGSGKLQEIIALRAELGASVILFDAELSPRQQREIEKAVKDDDIKVIDRTALILDIFAKHARTREGALQVELAQYEFRLPRLTRAWTHLARQAGGGSAASGTGGVGLRGPGETQLEVDRREIGRRIAHLAASWRRYALIASDIASGARCVAEHRVVGRLYQRRQEHAAECDDTSGRAGGLGLGVLSADMLFATLDPTTRRVRLPGGARFW